MTERIPDVEFRSPTSNPAPVCYLSATQHIHGGPTAIPATPKDPTDPGYPPKEPK